jgi:hypothetical protein
MRVFHLRVGPTFGTAFTIDHNQRQYLITARHVVEELDATASEVLIYKNNSWNQCPIHLCGHGEGDVDVSVLSPRIQLSPMHPLPATSAGMVFGQDVYFLGFPHGLKSEIGALNRDFPLPLVKKACLSGFLGSGPNEILLLDGHGNSGFSGGPVVLRPGGVGDLQVVGVISAYRYEPEPTYYGDAEFPLTVRINTGIIVVHAIQRGIEIIERNPNGYELPSTNSERAS